MSRCVAPRCPNPAAGHPLLCPDHQRAPAGQRGGWLSAHRRRMVLMEEQHPVVGVDASNVYPKLWIGGAPPADRKLSAFSMLVLCAREYQPSPMAFGGRVLRAPMDDHAPTEAELRTTAMAARRVAGELKRGGRVLVTCWAGHNRSGMVAALSLMLVCRMPMSEIIFLFRQRRSEHCLSNPHFVDFLRRCDAGRPRRGC